MRCETRGWHPYRFRLIFCFFFFLIRIIPCFLALVLSCVAALICFLVFLPSLVSLSHFFSCSACPLGPCANRMCVIATGSHMQQDMDIYLVRPRTASSSRVRSNERPRSPKMATSSIAAWQFSTLVAKRVSTPRRAKHSLCVHVGKMSITFLCSYLCFRFVIIY